MRQISHKVGQTIEADVLVIGGGLAGTYAALKALEFGAGRTLLVDKSSSGKSGTSAFAAGVFCSFIPEEDDFDVWFREIVELGEYMNDQDWLYLHLREVFSRAEEMGRLGVRFERRIDGTFERNLGRGGSPERPLRNIMFHGPQMMEAMRESCRARGVTLVDWVTVTDLVLKGSRVVGAVGFASRTGESILFKAKATVLASGGCRFKTFLSGHRMTTGDGLAMLYRAGGALMNMEFTQSNSAPTRFDMSGPGMNMFVGLGARLVNGLDQPFMSDYDPVYKERAPLRSIAAAMALEVKMGRSPISIDMTHFTEEQVMKLKRVLPLSTKTLERIGILHAGRITRKVEWAPIAPCTGSFGGGARVTTAGETNIPGLFAAGDATAKMAAGTNEMGAGALSCAAVTGAVAGASAALYAARSGPGEVPDMRALRPLLEAIFRPLDRSVGVDPRHVVMLVQEAITPYEALIIRRDDRLRKALSRIEWIRDNQVPHLFASDPHGLRLAHEARNMVLCAEMILRASLARKESRGTGLREDYPLLDNVDWLKWITVAQIGDHMTIEALDIPFERYRVVPPKEKVRHPLFKAAEKRGLQWA